MGRGGGRGKFRLEINVKDKSQKYCTPCFFKVLVPSGIIRFRIPPRFESNTRAFVEFLGGSPGEQGAWVDSKSRKSSRASILKGDRSHGPVVRSGTLNIPSVGFQNRLKTLQTLHIF